MEPNAALAGMGVVLAQTVLLDLVSRKLLLRLVVGTVAARSSGRLGRLLLVILRLPGNLLHELSHATGYLVSGYLVEDLATCFGDREGRGYCRAGRPWSPLAWLPLASAIASVLPLFAGALAVRGLAVALGIALPGADLTAGGAGSVAGRLLPDVAAFLAGLDWRAWETYLFWYLSLSIGAELAPSDVDLRRGAPLLAVLAGLLVLILYAVPHMELQPGSAEAISHGFWWALSTLSTALSAGLVGCGVLGVVAWAVAVAVRSRRAPASPRSQRRSHQPSEKSRPRSGRRGSASYRR